jgi:hypothetical protein
LWSLELANAIWLSAALKKSVKLPLDRKAYDLFLDRKQRSSRFKKPTGVTERVTDPKLNR